MHNQFLNLSQKIIQALMYFGESTSFVEIVKFLNIKKEDLQTELENNNLTNTANLLGLRLIVSQNNLELCLANEISEIINKNKLSQLKEDLSESSLEVIAITLYKNNVTKAEIDFIRGVDSGRSIRTLLTRGLIEKIILKNRTYYHPSTETLKYLSINNKQDLIEFTEINTRLQALIEGKD